MIDKQSPNIIEFLKVGNDSFGFINVAEKSSLPFVVKRIHWTYFTPENILRGHHAHHALEQILVAVAGTITVGTEMPGGITKQFVLNSPDKGLYIPTYCWHVMSYTSNAVQMCIANMEYDELDYIRDYEQFKSLRP